MRVVNLSTAFASVTDHWSPKVVGQVNDQYVKLAKIHGTLAWHKHDTEDELFLVMKGRMRIEYEGGVAVELGEGDMHVVPRDTLHNPVADEECWIALIETVTTKHTGDVDTPLTKSIDQQLSA
ncbi:cupin domain-containing protein [Niveispirillum sp. KHB5.9]|uniref:cupin domain-containing protein n=1 Tax=Niveispirillum sp. KHB5.9 TaxID=3400269 RepID=UPI003A8C047A